MSGPTSALQTKSSKENHHSVTRLLTILIGAVFITKASMKNTAAIKMMSKRVTEWWFSLFDLVCCAVVGSDMTFPLIRFVILMMFPSMLIGNRGGLLLE